MTETTWLSTTQYWKIHNFLADRLAELGPAAKGEPLPAGANALLIVHGDLLTYRDHGALSSEDRGFIDGFGLAVRHLAGRWSDHPDFDPAWAPPRTDVHDLLEGTYR